MHTYLCDTVFPRSVSGVSDLLVMTCSLKSTHAEVFGHKGVTMMKGVSLEIILGHHGRMSC